MTDTFQPGQQAFAVGVNSEYVVTVRPVTIDRVYSDLVVTGGNSASWKPERVFASQAAADAAAMAIRDQFAANRNQH